jgi:peptide/nickel transport system permease protein
MASWIQGLRTANLSKLPGVALAKALSRTRQRTLQLAIPGAPLIIGGVSMLVFVLAAALLAPWLAPSPPSYYDPNQLLASPSRDHPLGTDFLGRDVFSLILFGARPSLEVGIGASVLSSFVGVPLGLISGRMGGRLDFVLMRLIELVMAFPSLVLAMVIAVFLGPGLWTIIIALGIVSTPAVARLIRGQTLAIREREFVLAAVALGATEARIVIHHILPNVAYLVAVQAAITMGGALLTEASLSFLGFGLPPPTPSWGRLLREGASYLPITPWMSISAGFAVFYSVLAFYLLAEGFQRSMSGKRGPISKQKV